MNEIPANWPPPSVRLSDLVGHYIETITVHTETGPVTGLYSSRSGTVRTVDGRYFTGWTEHPDGSITPTRKDPA